MSKIIFNDFAKKVIVSLKALERDLEDCTFNNADWCEFLLDELEDLDSESVSGVSHYEKIAIIWDEE
jgi:hypothetical protein